MTTLQGILLGILQGIAEFLPISSSGHLKIAQNLFDLKEIPLLFDIFLHLATLAAVCIYFWPKIWKLLKVLFRWIFKKERPESEAEDFQDSLCGTEEAGRKTILAILVTTFITGLIGILTSKFIPEMKVKAVCVGFIITSIMLIYSSIVGNKNNKLTEECTEKCTEEGKEGNKEKVKGISLKQSILIGILQGFGTLPGISRSGSTISGALMSKVDRKSAGDYSFIVSIPAILGAFILELKDLGSMSQAVGLFPLIAGCIASFAVGFISLVLLMKIIRKGKLQWFAIYLLPVAILGIIFL